MGNLNQWSAKLLLYACLKCPFLRLEESQAMLQPTLYFQSAAARRWGYHIPTCNSQLSSSKDKCTTPSLKRFEVGNNGLGPIRLQLVRSENLVSPSVPTHQLAFLMFIEF